MSTDTVMLLDSIIIHIEYLLGRYFAAWMLHSCMSKADEPCYSEKNKKYLLMEVTKLVGFFFFPNRERDIQETSKNPSLRFCGERILYPQLSCTSELGWPLFPEESIVTETQAIEGMLCLRKLKVRDLNRQERQNWRSLVINHR